MNITVPVEQSLITAILFGRIMIFFLIYIVIYWIEIFLLPCLLYTSAKVVVLDRSEEAGKALVDSIKAEGNEAMFLYTDVMRCV